MISFQCPGCAKQYQIKDEAAGRKAKCRRCGHIATLPTKTADADAHAAVPEESRRLEQAAAATEPPVGRAPLAKTRITPGKRLAIALTGLLALALVIAVLASISPSKPTTAAVDPRPSLVHSAPAPVSEEEEARQTVIDWLENMKHGGDGKSYWPKTLSRLTTGRS